MPFVSQNTGAGLLGEDVAVLIFLNCPKMALKCLKIAPDEPKMTPSGSTEGPKKASRDADHIVKYKIKCTSLQAGSKMS